MFPFVLIQKVTQELKKILCLQLERIDSTAHYNIIVGVYKIQSGV